MQKNAFRSQIPPIYLLWEGNLHCLQTQTDSLEAVIRASSSPLVTDPSRAEVMREQREREGWNEKQQEESRPCLVIFLLMSTQMRKNCAK